MTLVLQCACAGTDTDPLESGQRVGTTGHQNQFRAECHLFANQQRKFDVVADRDGTADVLDLEQQMTAATSDPPFFALEAGHALLVLDVLDAIGGGDETAIAIDRIRVAHRNAAADNGHAKALRAI